MTKILFIIICLFSTFYTNANSSKDTIDNFLNSVIYLRWKNKILEPNKSDKLKLFKSYEYSTGFFIHKITLINGKPIIRKYLVTCKHCLPDHVSDANLIELRVYKNGKNPVFIPLIIKNSNGNYTDNIVFGKNGEDIAVIDITEFWFQENIQNKSLPYEKITNVEDLTKWEFNAGDLLYFLGFPNSIYDSDNPDPILRLGVTASDPKKPYNFNKEIQDRYTFKKYFEGFLLDASIFNGSSGSLVFYFPMKYPHGKGQVNNFLTTNNTKSISFREDAIIFGMVIKSFTDKDIDDQKIDLGIVLSYKVIKQTIDAFIY